MQTNITTMKRIIAILSLLLMCNTANAYINRGVATLRVMDKAAGKTQILQIPVGQSVQYEKLKIIVRSCKQSDPFDAENFWAFVEIYTDDMGRIFSNWFNRNEPGDNPLQNPDYDVWLAGCE